MEEGRLRRLRELADDARKAGAKGFEALAEATVGTRLVSERARIVSETAIDEDTLVVRVWLDGGRGGVATGTLARGDAIVGRALKAASKADEDAFAGPVSRLQGVLGGLGVHDRRYAQLTRDDRADVLVSAERSVRATDRRLSPAGFAYEDRRTHRSFLNSKGVALDEWSTAYQATGQAHGDYGGTHIVRSAVVEARTFASIASLPFGTDVARRAVGLMKDGERPDGPVRVMLAPLAAAQLFGALGACFRYDLIADGGFFLRPRDDGEPVIDHRIHLVDDGTVPGAFRSRSFDDRGVAPVPLTLLREGRVEGRFIDPNQARRLEVRPTGHHSGGALRPTNLLLRAGSRSINALLTELKQAVFLLEELPSLDGALDPVTGDLALVVSGKVLHGTRQIGAHRNATLSGNLLEVLNQVVDLASNTDRHGHVDAGGLMVDGFHLTPA